jgi:hypothetical protein
MAIAARVIEAGSGTGLGRVVELICVPPPEIDALLFCGPNGLVKYRMFENPVPVASKGLNDHLAFTTVAPALNISVLGACPPLGEVQSST